MLKPEIKYRGIASMTTTFYHKTTKRAVRAIMESGFKDGRLSGTDEPGVSLSLVPFDVNDGAKGDTLLEVTVDLPEAQLDEYEVIEDKKSYREWLIPAGVLKDVVASRLSTNRMFRATFLARLTPLASSGGS